MFIYTNREDSNGGEIGCRPVSPIFTKKIKRSMLAEDRRAKKNRSCSPEYPIVMFLQVGECILKLLIHPHHIQNISSKFNTPISSNPSLMYNRW